MFKKTALFLSDGFLKSILVLLRHLVWAQTNKWNMYYSHSKSYLIFSCARLDWDDKGYPLCLNNFFSFNSHNLIITSTNACWTWLFPVGQLCFAFRTIWNGQDEIFKATLFISSHSSISLFKANILWGKDNFFRDQKISCYLCSLFHLKAWLLRKGLHWKRRRAEQVIRIWGGSKTCLHLRPNQIYLYALYVYNHILYKCVLNNGHLFPFWMVRTWLASKPAAAVTIANRKQIWYLLKSWHIQTLMPIRLHCYNCNYFTHNDIAWMRVIKSMKYVRSIIFGKSHSLCKHKSYNAMYKDFVYKL